MSGTRVALLIGCAEYDNPTLTRLPARQNVGALARVLADPAIGGFRVETMLDQPSEMVTNQIEGFFADGKRGDLLLLYFSCHGVLDPRGRLYFATTNTKDELLDSTGISAERVRQWMDNSRSKRIVLLLDCCYSGAFRGLTRGSADAKEIFQQQLGGHGRVVITASNKLERAHDSVFTDAVVAGLETGDADRDGDGLVSIYELYQYVHDQVQAKRPDQTPTLSTDGMIGELFLANNPHEPLPLPDDLDQALRSRTVWQRRGAIYGLELLLAGDHPGGQKRTARQELLRLRDHDTDPDVRAAAGKELPRVPPAPDVTGSLSSGVSRPITVREALLAVALTAFLVIAPFVIVEVVSTVPDRPVIATPKPITSCSPNIRSADGVLSMGTLLPKTGAFVYPGPATDAGAHLAIKDIKDSGGIPGIAVTLDEANQRDEGDPSADTASQSADALKAGGVDAIIGPGRSAVALKVIDKVVCASVIMFAPATTSPVFTEYEDHGFYFRTAPSNALEAPLLGKLVVDDGNSTAVVISHNDEYANPLREATEKAIRESGRQVLDSFSYEPNAREYDKEVQRIKAKNPDAIVLIGFTESAQILAKMIEEGIGPMSKRVYGSDSNMTNTLARQVSRRDPGVLEGMRGILPYAGDDAFVKRLTEANPGLQDLTYAAHAYDAVVITALAAAVAGTDESAVIAKEINKITKDGEKCTSFAACMTLVEDRKDIDYDGSSGPLEFTDPGEPRSATYVISEIQADGTVKPLRSEKVGPLS